MFDLKNEIAHLNSNATENQVAFMSQYEALNYAYENL